MLWKNMKFIEQWTILLRECVARRVDVDGFWKLAQALSRRAPLQQTLLVDVLLESRSVTADIFPYDPLVPRYTTALRKLGLIRTSTLLDGLRKHSSIGREQDKSVAADQESQKTVVESPSTLMTDSRIVQDIIVPLSSSSLPLSIHEVQNIFLVAAKWILAVVRWHTSNISDDQQSGGLMSSQDALALFESLGILLIALSGTEKGHEALSSQDAQGKKSGMVSISTVLVSDIW